MNLAFRFLFLVVATTFYAWAVPALVYGLYGRLFPPLPREVWIVVGLAGAEYLWHRLRSDAIEHLLD